MGLKCQRFKNKLFIKNKQYFFTGSLTTEYKLNSGEIKLPCNRWFCTGIPFFINFIFSNGNYRD